MILVTIKWNNNEINTPIYTAASALLILKVLWGVSDVIMRETHYK